MKRIIFILMEIRIIFFRIRSGMLFERRVVGRMVAKSHLMFVDFLAVDVNKLWNVSNNLKIDPQPGGPN